MKNQYLRTTVALGLSVLMLAGCSNSKVTSQSDFAKAHKNETVYGEIASISDGKITVNLGSLPSTSSTNTASQGTTDTAPTFSLELTGETVEIALDDSITLSSVSMMGMGGFNGQMPDANSSATTENQQTDTESSATSENKPGNRPQGGKDGKTPPSGNAPGKTSSDTNPFSGAGKTQTITADDLAVGDAIAIEVDALGGIVSIQVMKMDAMPSGTFDGMTPPTDAPTDGSSSASPKSDSSTTDDSSSATPENESSTDAPKTGA